MGFKLVSSPIGIKNQPYNRKVYEPLWKTLEETGLVFSLHFNTGTEDHLPDNVGEEDDDNGFLPYMIISMAEGIEPVSHMLASGVPMRHPGLDFVVVECGAGWLAWVLYALDEQYQRKHMWIEPKLEMDPSDYFKRQGHATFGDDPRGPRHPGLHRRPGPAMGQRLPPRRGHLPPFAGGNRPYFRRLF